MEIYWSQIAESGHQTAYELLAKAWSQHSSQPMPMVSLEDKGKPYFPGNPLYFSLSHTKKLAVCAVGECPLGVDVEMIRDLKQGVAQRVLTPKELKWLQNQDEDTQAFFLLWTKKESYVKFTGQGFDGAPQKVDTFGISNVSWISKTLEDCVCTLCLPQDYQGDVSWIEITRGTDFC